MEERLNDIEIALTNLEKTVDEMNTELIRQAKIIEKLERENKALKETIGGNVKPLSEETPPPHY
ncbi:MAG: SlyX family protein [Alphaproteobacteria bacterium]|nr:SlyX family protein [Alphaproteobacteria bacterium]